MYRRTLLFDCIIQGLKFNFRFTKINYLEKKTPLCLAGGDLKIESEI